MSLVHCRLISRLQTNLKYALKFSFVQRTKARFSQLSSVVYVWGAGDGGQLGTGTQRHSPLPVKFSLDEEIGQVGCGYGFTLAADTKCPRIWSTGLNTFSQLGRQLNGGKEKDIALTPAATDIPIAGPSAKVLQICCGRSHSMVLMDDGKVFACGGNYHGQCGTACLDACSVRELTEVPAISNKIKQIACGFDHTLLLTIDGQVFSCGWGADGQTGLGHFNNESSFKVVEGALKDVNVKEVATSGDSCLALSVDGEVFSWGNNEYNQLGTTSDEEQTAVPTVASLLKNLPEIKQVSAGGSNCVALTASGDVYSWGYGVLGHGQEIPFTKIPQKIQAFEIMEEVVIGVSCGPDYSAAVTDSGELYTWGRGSFGRLGLGSNEDQWIPNKVVLPGKVVNVSCGVDHMAVVVKLG